MCVVRGLVMFCWYVVQYVGTWVHRVVRYVGKVVRYGYTVRWYVETARGTVRRYVGTVRGQVGTIPGTVCWHLVHARWRGLPTSNNLSIIMFVGDGHNETQVARQGGWLPIPVQPELAPCK